MNYKIIRSSEPIEYNAALEQMSFFVNELKIKSTKQKSIFWFLEHPSIYTAGTSADPKEIFNPFNLPVYQTGRGGRYTYHGPGQLILYCMVDLRKVGLCVSDYVKTLELWVIDVLGKFGVDAILCPAKIGVWVKNPYASGEVIQQGHLEKIAALGIRVSSGITSHGISFNIAPDLTHFKGIVPCGIYDYGVTSLQKMCIKTSFHEVCCAFEDTMPAVFK